MGNKDTCNLPFWCLRKESIFEDNTYHNQINQTFQNICVPVVSFLISYYKVFATKPNFLFQYWDTYSV